MNLNANQVKLTNDASTISKCSAVSKGYFQDDFIEEFVEKKKSRASLIHLGYYTRAVILNKLINDCIGFMNLQKCLKFQIISCGCGFDTMYWKLSEADLLSKPLLIEIDFSDVIQRKVLLIKQSEKLKSYVNPCGYNQGIHKINYNYFLLEADLSDLSLIERLFKDINIDYDAPTLFLSECVITYMKESDSSNLIKWMTDKFKNPAFINYEQIHPDDGFGQVMLKHFEKLKSSLFSVAQYPNSESHYLRYENLGFKSSLCISEWDALIWLTTEEERQRVLCLELFDEFEEFHLKCVHYIIAIVGNGICSSWINGFSPDKNSSCNKANRKYLKAEKLSCDLGLFRHSCCTINGSNFVFGGCRKESRSSKIYRINHADFLHIKELKNLENNASINIDMVYGSAVSFEINKVPFICLYGGRRSPNKVSNDGSPILFELIDSEFLPRLVINKGSVIPRYRSPMVCLQFNESETHCWIFGGRTTDLKQSLSDFWELSIKGDHKKNITVNWKPYEKSKNWPCSRMSHSFSACQKRFELFIIGGLMVDSSTVLNDIWKWCCRSESWEQVQLTGNLLPRYGHTAHLKDDMIYLLGGVNTLAGVQPGLGAIDLANLTVIEYEILPSVPEPFLLFNHTSELIGDGDDACIYIIGGGGNCFSFGTFLNQFGLSIKLNQLD